jgi:plasmid stability protein
MGQVLVRNLDDGVIERLKRKAVARGTSLEQVAREVLTAAAAEMDDRKAWAERMDALRAQTTFDPTWDSVAVIREWRDYDRMTRLLDEQEAEKAAKGKAPKE